MQTMRRLLPLRRESGRRFKLARAVMAAVATVGAVTVASDPASAAVNVTNGPCSLTAYNPYIEWSNGVKYARANFRVYCSSTRTVTVAKRIYENDPPGNPDDLVASHNESETFSGWQTFHVRGRCTGFDPWGNEELYSKAAITINYTPSSWARSLDVSVNC